MHWAQLQKLQETAAFQNDIFEYVWCFLLRTSKTIWVALRKYEGNNGKPLESLEIKFQSLLFTCTGAAEFYILSQRWLTALFWPRYGVPNPSWKRRSDACLDQRSIGVLGSWLIQVADVLFFVVAKATGAGGADSQNGCAEEAGDCQDLTTICAFFWCQNGTPVIACHCINANPGLTNIVNSRFMTLTINWEGYPQNSDKLIQYYIYKYMCACTWLVTLTKIHWFMAMGMALFCSGWGREESL